MTRPLSPAELIALSTYLPMDLTREQLDDVILAASHACEQAFDQGRSSNGIITDLINRCPKENK